MNGDAPAGSFVYLAWGAFGEDFTVHSTRAGAIAMLRETYPDLADRIDGEPSPPGLDGCYVDTIQVRP